MSYPLAHRIQRPSRYVPALNSDIRKTFARLKREAKKQQQPKEQQQ